ncbi:MAG: deoxyuridine 5'-triphosphate nucleotidohydrolase [SAR202 cluster bacterium Io17-Chloro-G4]|nr:MAG: deoxyuridine 5'-triphosphate nucleotidohydrolase [SAR202 cluster bacterium Io17-Chloro-G4]
MNGNPLDRESIGRLIHNAPPLVEDFRSLEQQLQPNGFDLSLKQVSSLVSPGNIGAEPDQREVSELENLQFGPDGWLQLSPGPYLVTFNEVVNLPLDVMALGRPRSSLLRSGVSVHTAVWDSGYRGRSQSLLVVYHPGGYRVQKNARLMQLVFFQLSGAVSQGYQGRFQSENIG